MNQTAETGQGQTGIQGHPVNLLACRFNVMTERDAFAQIVRWRDEVPRRTHTLVTVNVAILMMMREDARLRDAVERADLVVADGQPLIWASRMFGVDLPERVSGVDLMQRLLEEGGQHGLRLYLLGTTEERLQSLLATIRQRHPEVTIAGARNGYFKEQDWPEVIRDIRESGADVLLVGMPAPFKEVWCEEHRDALQIPTVLGVGGAFDVIAGRVKRAPKVLQKAGLEWAWRLTMEPRKLWKRYLVTNARFFGELFKAMSGQLRRAAPLIALGMGVC
ncbi:MAG: WecB/TagA/CpsF family glycosyltransferase [Myxococcaceae bacterium]